MYLLYFNIIIEKSHDIWGEHVSQVFINKKKLCFWSISSWKIIHPFNFEKKLNLV